VSEICAVVLLTWEDKRTHMPYSSLREYLTNFERLGDECAYVHRRGYRTERWSYGQIASTAFQFARELESRGVAKGDRVLIWGENCAEWVVTFFGCVALGAVVVPMDHFATADFAQRVYQQVGAGLLVCSQKHAARGVTQTRVILEELTEIVGRQAGNGFSSAEATLGDTLEIVFTSGTTAEPKGVVITHGNVLANVAPLEKEIRKYLKYERWVHPVRFLNLLPLSHVFGQFMGIFLPQFMGGTVLFQEAQNASEVANTIHRERVSVLIAVPRMLQSLKEKIERDMENKRELARFREKFRGSEGKHFLRRWWIFRRVRRQFGWKFWAFICGGAALDRETEEFWGRLGYAVVQGYGLTETTSLISLNHPFRLGKGSIGKVLPGREIQLAGDGEIMVRGGGVASSYWDGKERKPVAGEEGWYRTGDIGEIDAVGNLYFKGRKKDVIVTPAGLNIYPEDLEAALRAQPELRDCVVIGLECGGNVEPCAVLILREGYAAADAVRRANDTLAEYQRMNEWYVWPEEDFPRTSTQKPRTSAIREVVQSQLNSHSNRATASPLRELIERVSGQSVGQLKQESDLDADLNLSSLDRVELLSALEDRYQVDLSETKFASLNKVGDLERLLRGSGVQRVKYHYPRWTLRWPVRWVRTVAHYLLLRPAVFLLGKPVVKGRENLKYVRGPVLLVCNHIDDVDVGFVLSALPARLRHWLATAAGGEALEALRTPAKVRGTFGGTLDRLKWVLGVALLNLFPLPREAAFRKSFAYAGEAVDRGYSVLVFPEGHHTTDGQMKPFRAGIGLLAKNLGVPVIPMRIDGLFEIKKAGKRFAPRGKIRVLIGEPVRFEPDTDPSLIAMELQQKVTEL
jgi:long-chain acyl-CoA synthetase